MYKFVMKMILRDKANMQIYNFYFISFYCVFHVCARGRACMHVFKPMIVSG